MQVLDQWESLYRRLSDEFIEAKQRKVQLRMLRNRFGYTRPVTTRRPRIVRTGELALDPRLNEEM
jgi:hypothetical protein